MALCIGGLCIISSFANLLNDTLFLAFSDKSANHLFGRLAFARTDSHIAHARRSWDVFALAPARSALAALTIVISVVVPTECHLSYLCITASRGVSQARTSQRIHPTGRNTSKFGENPIVTG